MSIFGSKREAWVTAIAAAFFVLVALYFTFEPLWRIVAAAKALPSGTVSWLMPAPWAKSADLVSALSDEAKGLAQFSKSASLLEKTRKALLELDIKSVAILPDAALLESAKDADGAVKAVRTFLSKLTPFEIKTLLPDNTSMIEIVIDPKLIKVEDKIEGDKLYRVFTQTLPQLAIEKNGLTSKIILNYPHVVGSNTYPNIETCTYQSGGTKRITVSTGRYPLPTAIIKSILPYLSDYSCFQGFSTAK